MDREVVCNICSSSEFTVLYEAGVAQIHRIVRCAKCGLIYANPLLDEFVAPAKSDPPASPAKETFVGDSDFYLRQRVIKEQIQVDDYRRTREYLNLLHPLRGRLLDIGSGFGSCLNAFKNDGWEVQGIEPVSVLNRYARNHFGLTVDEGFFGPGIYPEASFDVVIMNHVIEHVPDPTATMREINRVLKPNGHAVIETPRYDSWMFRLLGRRERSLSCNGHIYFFTGDSLRRLSDAAGFRAIDHRSTGRTLTLGRLLWNIGVVSHSAWLKRAIERLSKSVDLEGVRVHLNLGDIQRICLEKRPPELDPTSLPAG